MNFPDVSSQVTGVQKPLGTFLALLLCSSGSSCHWLWQLYYLLLLLLFFLLFRLFFGSVLFAVMVHEGDSAAELCVASGTLEKAETDVDLHDVLPECLDAGSRVVADETAHLLLNDGSVVTRVEVGVEVGLGSEGFPAQRTLVAPHSAVSLLHVTLQEVRGVHVHLAVRTDVLQVRLFRRGRTNLCIGGG